MKQATHAHSKRALISSSIVLGLGLLADPVMALDETIEEDGKKVQRVAITGSAIKRLDAETAAPVDVYTKKDIERTGATTVAELIKSLATIDIYDQGELSGNSPAGSGTATVKMRGLSSRNVLVLLNGRRLPTNAMADGSGAGSAVDVNTIPVSVLERVEILKDGGSAIYGADAVAGVMNFITKKNYEGFEVKTGYGQAAVGDAQEKTASVVYGFGDYDENRFNVLATVDILRRSPVYTANRDITRSADWRRMGGLDGRSGFHPSGNIVGGGQVKPCPPEDVKGSSCRFDYNKSLLTAINGADRVNGMLIGSFKVNSTTRAFTEFIYSENKDHFLSQPAPGNFKMNGKTVAGRFMQIGPRTTDRKGSLAQFTVGLEGSNFDIDWDVAIGRGQTKVSNSDSNYMDKGLFYKAIDNGWIDPTSTTNSEAEINKFRIRPYREATSKLTFINAKASAPIMPLAGGSLAYAVGFSVNKEALEDTPDFNQINDNVFGGIRQAAVNASRTSSGVFGELSIPFHKNVEAQVAARYDNISNVGSKTSPKVAIRYQPLPSLMLRASYAGSFLAPTLKQMFGGQEAGAETTENKIICAVFSPISGACEPFSYSRVSGSNLNLKPETGKTFNFGVVIEPISAVSIGVDYFRINKKNEIGKPSVFQALKNGHFGVVNGEAQIYMTNQNMASTDVEGFDIDLRYKTGSTPLGKITVRNTTTWYTKTNSQEIAGEDMGKYLGTFANPKYRNVITASLDNDEWNATASVRTVGGMIDFASSLDNIPPGTRFIPAHSELDVMGQYTGLKNLTFTGGVKNLMDKMPPYSDMGTLGQYGSGGFAQLYSPRGRYLYVGLNYKFY